MLTFSFILDMVIAASFFHYSYQSSTKRDYRWSFLNAAISIGFLILAVRDGSILMAAS